MFSSTTFANPTFQKNIRLALWLARMENKKTGWRAVQYVKNKTGLCVLRVEVYGGSLIGVYALGQNSKKSRNDARKDFVNRR